MVFFYLNGEVLHSGQDVNDKGINDTLFQGVTSVPSKAGPLSLSSILYPLHPPFGPECHLKFQSPLVASFPSFDHPDSIILLQLMAIGMLTNCGEGNGAL